MFGQLRAKVSAGLTKVRGLAVAAFDPFILLLTVYPFGFSLSLTLVGARRKVLMVVGANTLGAPGELLNLWTKSYGVTNHMKPLQQYFHMVLFI